MKVLIDFDAGFIARLERERQVAQNTTGKRPARTSTIRELLVEALDSRCTSRGEPIPTVFAEVSPETSDIAPETTSPSEAA